MGHDQANADESVELAKEQVRLWLSIMRMHGTVSTELNRKLSAEVGISLAKFDTMSHLYRFPDGLSMSELSDALRVSNGNVSGLVNRLIREGFVFKEMSKTDRRSFQARLTDLGKATFEEALQTHRHVLSKLFSQTNPKALTATLQNLRSLNNNLVSDE